MTVRDVRYAALHALRMWIARNATELGKISDVAVPGEQRPPLSVRLSNAPEPAVAATEAATTPQLRQKHGRSHGASVCDRYGRARRFAEAQRTSNM